MVMMDSPYHRRFALFGPLIAEPPVSGLSMVVVIPARDEPDVLSSLNSIWQCDRPEHPVEVILVVNGSAADCETVRDRNRHSFRSASRWAQEHRDPRLRFHALHIPDMAPRHAGVGLARKIGMDEGARRLRTGAGAGTATIAAGGGGGILVAFDADCTCRTDYLTAIEHHFRSHPLTPGCSIYFEHPLAGPEPDPVYRAIVLYELHLRYYVQALRFAGFPYAHHTVGSSMAVRAPIYEGQGGMNKRKAGEDFYFLHKIIPLGAYTDLTDTVVYPSPRVSDRVPFGTGRAVGDHLTSGSAKFASYPLAAFHDMRVFSGGLNRLIAATDDGLEPVLNGMPESVRSFLAENDFEAVWAEAKRHSASETAFRKRLSRWFNGFRAMKFVHHARDRFYGAAPVTRMALDLWAAMDGTVRSDGERDREGRVGDRAGGAILPIGTDTATETGSPADAVEVLRRFRALDAGGTRPFVRHSS